MIDADAAEGEKPESGDGAEKGRDGAGSAGLHRKQQDQITTDIGTT